MACVSAIDIEVINVNIGKVWWACHFQNLVQQLIAIPYVVPAVKKHQNQKQSSLNFFELIRDFPILGVAMSKQNCANGNIFFVGVFIIEVSFFILEFQRIAIPMQKIKPLSQT